jgi:hypothetical protein
MNQHCTTDVIARMWGSLRRGCAARARVRGNGNGNGNGRRAADRAKAARGAQR